MVSTIMISTTLVNCSRSEEVNQESVSELKVGSTTLSMLFNDTKRINVKGSGEYTISQTNESRRIVQGTIANGVLTLKSYKVSGTAVIKIIDRKSNLSVNMIISVKDLRLSRNSLNMKVGETEEVQIEGSGDYEISRSDFVSVRLSSDKKSLIIKAEKKAKGAIVIYDRVAEKGLRLDIEVIPAEDYELSEDGKTLIEWLNPNTREINFNTDPKLRNVTTIGGYLGRAFRNHKNLRKITLSNNVTTIRGSVFSNCTALETVVFSNKLKSIEELAFNGCTSLNNVEIPASVESISIGVFSGCTALKTAFMNPTKLPAGFAPFDRNIIETIYVPRSALKTYINSYWGVLYFGKIVERPLIIAK